MRRCDAINKVYRSYHGQVERVTDVVRCSIVFTTVDELVRFIEVSLRDSLNFGHFKALPKILSARFNNIHFQEIDKRNSSVPKSKPFEVVRVRNRLNPNFDSRHSSGECRSHYLLMTCIHRSLTLECSLLRLSRFGAES